MTYSEKVKAAKTIITAIQALKSGEEIRVSYGIKHNGTPKYYVFSCYEYQTSDREKSFSIADAEFRLNSMNISALTNTQAKAYSYDLMSQRTTYNFPLYQMKIVSE